MAYSTSAVELGSDLTHGLLMSQFHFNPFVRADPQFAACLVFFELTILLQALIDILEQNSFDHGDNERKEIEKIKQMKLSAVDNIANPESSKAYFLLLVMCFSLLITGTILNITNSQTQQNDKLNYTGAGINALAIIGLRLTQYFSDYELAKRDIKIKSSIKTINERLKNENAKISRDEEIPSEFKLVDNDTWNNVSALSHLRKRLDARVAVLADDKNSSDIMAELSLISKSESIRFHTDSKTTSIRNTF